MAYEFRMKSLVHFSDTDMAGIMHFSRYFIYMEKAEHEFFRSLKLKLHENKIDEMYGWPRVDAKCNYIAPLNYDDEMEIHLEVINKGEKSLTYKFTFSKLTPEGSVVTAVGSLKTVFVTKNLSENIFMSCVMPAEINNKIEQSPT